MPAFGLGGLCVTFGWVPMTILSVFAMCTHAVCSEVGGFQGGHRKGELIFGAVRALYKNTPQTHKRCPQFGPCRILMNQNLV